MHILVVFSNSIIKKRVESVDEANIVLGIIFGVHKAIFFFFPTSKVQFLKLLPVLLADEELTRNPEVNMYVPAGFMHS